MSLSVSRKLKVKFQAIAAYNIFLYKEHFIFKFTINPCHANDPIHFNSDQYGSEKSLVLEYFAR